MPSFDVRYAAKFWVALVGLIASAVVASAEGVPSWLPVVSVVCSAVATYLVPNDYSAGKSDE